MSNNEITTICQAFSAKAPQGPAVAQQLFLALRHKLPQICSASGKQTSHSQTCAPDSVLSASVV
jgi:hypothetical protein